jgi:hypothetical protein
MTMWRNSLRRLLWFLAGLALCNSALGQVDPRIEVSPTIGYMFGGDLWDREAAGSSASVEDHLDYGLRAGWRASPRWTFEFDWTDVPTRLVFSGPLPPVELDIDFLTPRITYHFATGCFRPYLAAGFGAAIFDTGSGGEGYWAGTVAVGLKAFLTPAFGARIEARGFATGVGDAALGFPCTTFEGGVEGPVEPVSCAHDFILSADVTAGLVFAF